MSTCYACGADVGAAVCGQLCASSELLRELVELKRIKDTTGESEEYRRRKQKAWREAFALLNVIGDPK